jgi:hypothetical protein
VPPAVAVVEAVVVARRTVATSRCSMRCERRTTSPHRQQAGTSNLLLHDRESDECRRINRIRGETGARPPVESRSISPGAARSKAAEDFEDRKKT